MDLCRSKGIREISIDGVQFKLDDEPKTQQDASKDTIVTDGFNSYTDEQIATWSSGS